MSEPTRDIDAPTPMCAWTWFTTFNGRQVTAVCVLEPNHANQHYDSAIKQYAEWEGSTSPSSSVSDDVKPYTREGFAAFWADRFGWMATAGSHHKSSYLTEAEAARVAATVRTAIDAAQEKDQTLFRTRSGLASPKSEQKNG